MNQHVCKLTTEAIWDIYTARKHELQKVTAARHGVVVSTVCQIQTGKRHVKFIQSILEADVRAFNATLTSMAFREAA